MNKEELRKFITNFGIKKNIEIIESDNTFLKNSFFYDAKDKLSINFYDVETSILDDLLPISKYIKTLNISNYKEQVNNLSFLQKFTELQILDISLETDSIKGIGKLSNLEKLNLSYLKNENITELENLNLLKNLHLSFDDEVFENQFSSIKGLNNLKSLVSLSVSGIESISKICELPNLKELDLCNNGILSMKGLERFPNLENLNLYCSSFNEITNLETLKKLKKLNIHSTPITKIKGLDTLVNLEDLTLSHNSIPKMEGLENLINLKVLDLNNYLGESEAPIKKIEGIKYLSKLETIILTGHNIQEIDNLPTENLKNIYIDWNKIEKINYKWLASLKQNCTIHLTGNPIRINLDKVPKNVIIIKEK